ncbi:MAG: hypothetical protein L6V79_04595 [Clostridium sp.]|nr:MAG: hypothetical protein L6V79_04595 [Clostridium sp.]
MTSLKKSFYKLFRHPFDVRRNGKIYEHVEKNPVAPTNIVFMKKTPRLLRRKKVGLADRKRQY